jgi:DNA repair exonuclease SbcCD ATPase subunit
MKVRGEMMTGDGFDKNVAEKMPKIRKLEEPLSQDLKANPQLLHEDHAEVVEELKPSERQAESSVISQPPHKGMDTEPNLDVFRLIEDLHTQLLSSSRTKRALEMDLSSHEKTIQQLAQDNKDLRSQLENLRKEFQKLKEIQSESIYLKEENSDALEKIHEFQQELKGMNEALTLAIRERDEAYDRIQELESRMEQNELFQIKGRLKEREASHLSVENRELQSKLEEVSAHNLDLERKYETLKRSFNEVRESLTLLRDSYKTNYYNLSQNPE